ncbi:hypothetical protein SAMN05421820_101431 [Pedobacter steynii]|uniref:Uncharacterized protein n=1 Tax=Pedobacter steynii TaxID=430522 RepID=A0A1G9K0M9_9SPHI|nr:hypothetical protein [Pedobacter steynii]NQX38412.1 hypothetical protein [Pedobacter steynii]SDL43328.1 hypothetical protein SAMN05421820_101431 [Pedobacter steynii]
MRKEQTILNVKTSSGSNKTRKRHTAQEIRGNIKLSEVIDKIPKFEQIELFLKDILAVVQQTKYEVDFIKAIYTKPSALAPKKKTSREQEKLMLKHKILTRGKRIY